MIRRWRRRRLLRKVRERRAASVIITLAEEDFERLKRDLDKPAAPSPGLIELMRHKPPWEK